MKITKYLTQRGYTINKEFCGYKEKRYVLRYMGEYITQDLLYKEVLLASIFHDDSISYNILD